MAVDFLICTAALEPVAEKSHIVHMVGSSTEQDVQRNRMAPTAISDMCDPSLVGMNIFRNHKYELPQDLFGRLVDVPKAVRADGFVDVHLTVETDLDNPPAVQTLQQIHKGNKHGCSIGCMVNEWDFAGEVDDPFHDPIVIKHITPVEWSVVGIPANRRSWVENAIYGVFTRSMEEGNFDEAYRLAPTVKGLFSRNYERMMLSLSASIPAEFKRFSTVPARSMPDHQIQWEPMRKTFVLFNGAGDPCDVSRSQIAKVMQTGRLTAAFEDEALFATADATAKSAQEARSHKYGIGIKEGGNVTKPGQWASVPDSEWGDPVNYRYPMPDKAHADNAASRWGDASNRAQYDSHEQAIIGGRIKRRQASFGESADEKEKGMHPELVEAHVVIAPDGSHEPTFGHHSHPHSDLHEGLHDHHHVHSNDNTHAHAHDVHLAVTPAVDIDADGSHDDCAGVHSHKHSHGDMQHSHAHGHTHDHSHSVGPQHRHGDDAKKALDNPLEVVPTRSRPATPVPNSNDGDNDGDDMHAPKSSDTPRYDDGALEVAPAKNPGIPKPNGGSRDESHDHPAMREPLGGDPKLAALPPEQEALLASYNNIGRLLGFAPVDAAGRGDYREGLYRQIDAMAKFSTAMPDLVQQMLLALAADPALRLAGRKLSSESMAHAKRAHDALCDMTDGEVCSGASKSASPTSSDGTAQGQRGTPVGEAVDAARQSRQAVPNSAMFSAGIEGREAWEATMQRVREAENHLLTLNEQIDVLQGRGVGRPTNFANRSLPPGFMNDVARVPSPENLRSQTFITRRADGVKCRRWPAGVGKDGRPELTTKQMTLMSAADEDAYYDGREALIPIIDPTD